MSTIDDLEARVKSLEQAALPWMAKHWQIVAGITFVIGLVAGHVFK